MKLRTASLITSFLLLGVFTVLSFALMRVTDLLETEADELAQASKSIQVAQSLKTRLLTHNRNSFLFQLHKDPVRYVNRDKQHNEINELLQTAEQLTSRDRDRATLQSVKAKIEEYLQKRAAHANEPISPLEKYNLISKDVDNAIAEIERLIEINRDQMNELTAQVHKQNQRADRLSIILLSVGTSLILITLYGIYVLLTRPLGEISQTISSYKAGNSQERVQASGLHEVKVIAESYNVMADWLEEKRKEQMRFIASIAHDLKNPLNSISMASEVLVSQCQQESKELSQVIYDQVQSLDRLVGDLLDTTRIEAGHLRLNLSQCDLKSIITNSIGLYQTSSRVHRFIINLPESPITCACDANRLTQVFNNLISNAIKYSPNGGDIKIEALIESDLIHISIIDSGIGIDKSDLENIFKPFHRTKATRDSIPGIGLGLSASRKIIEAHKGQLKVTSSLGKGSTFQITLNRT